MQQIKLQKQECKREGTREKSTSKEGRFTPAGCKEPHGLSWPSAGVNHRSLLVLLTELFETLVNKHERHFYFESLDFDTAFTWIPVPRR